MGSIFFSMVPACLFDVINNSWMLLAGLASVSMLWWYWTSTPLRYTNLNIPPFPARPLPIVGHFFMLRSNLRQKVKIWRKKVGDVYSLRIGRELNILVNDFDILKEIAKKHSEEIINTAAIIDSKIMKAVNSGIVAARDDHWKAERATSVSVLRSLGMGKDVMATLVQEEVQRLVEKLADIRGEPVDPRLFIQTSVSSVICSVILGERFKNNDPLVNNILVTAKNINKYFLRVLMLTSVKMLYYLPFDIFHANKWVKAVISMSEVINPFITKYMINYSGGHVPENFIAGYIAQMNQEKERGVTSFLSTEDLAVTVRTLLIAGTESTSATILWCILYVLQNPKIQEKLYNEIETNVGIDRLPSMEDKHKLPYLNAVIMETQRRASVIPLGLRREVASSFEVGGFIFPEGSIMCPILDSVHNDKKIWGDPENFRPERFLDTSGALINREELIPFGIGRRICLGESLVRTELFIFLSAMFQHFKFESVDERDALSFSKECSAIVCEPGPFQIRCVVRK